MKHIRLILCVFILGIIPFLTFSSSAKVVIDQLGRSVHMPEHPNRIVSLAPNITEIIFALKQEHRLVGVTRFSDYPPEASRLPKVGSYVHLDLERIVSLNPDFCIAIKDGNPKDVADRLEALNIPVYAVDPRDLDAVIYTVLELGRLLNADEEAAALADHLRFRKQHISSQVSQASHRPGIFFQIGISPIVSVGYNTFIHQLIEDAGGKNLAQGPVPYPRFSREEVIALAPEIMIVSLMNKEDDFDQIKAEWNQWQDIPAVKNHRIYMVDSNLFNRPTPRLIDALEILAALIHPEFFKNTP